MSFQSGDVIAGRIVSIDRGNLGERGLRIAREFRRGLGCQDLDRARGSVSMVARRLGAAKDREAFDVEEANELSRRGVTNHTVLDDRYRASRVRAEILQADSADKE